MTSIHSLFVDNFVCIIVPLLLSLSFVADPGVLEVCPNSPSSAKCFPLHFVVLVSSFTSTHDEDLLELSFVVMSVTFELLVSSTLSSTFFDFSFPLMDFFVDFFAFDLVCLDFSSCRGVLKNFVIVDSFVGGDEILADGD